MRSSAVSKFTLAALVAACAMSVQAARVQAPGQEEDLVPTGKGWGERATPDRAAGKNASPFGSNGISYHGGPLLTGGVNVFYIWYGNWAGNSATTILQDLAQHIGGSPYFNINTTYYNGSNVHVTNTVAYAGFANDSYSQGTALSDSAVKAIVAAQNPTDT